MDKCLKVADYELYKFLKLKKLSATVYAFPCRYIEGHGRCLPLLIETLAYDSHNDFLCMHTALA